MHAFLVALFLFFMSAVDDNYFFTCNDMIRMQNGTAHHLAMLQSLLQAIMWFPSFVYYSILKATMHRENLSCIPLLTI